MNKESKLEKTFPCRECLILARCKQNLHTYRNSNVKVNELSMTISCCILTEWFGHTRSRKIENIKYDIVYSFFYKKE